MAPQGVPQSHPGGVWLASFNNSQRIRYMATLVAPQNHHGGTWLVSFNHSQRIRDMTPCWSQLLAGVLRK